MDRHIRWEFKYNSDDNQAEMEDEQNIREMMRPHAWRINRDLDPYLFSMREVSSFLGYFVRPPSQLDYHQSYI